MNLDDIIQLLGRSIQDSSVRDALISEGVDDIANLSTPDGEYRTYLEFPTRGFCLVLTDEAFFLGQRHKSLGAGPLYVSGCFLYSEGKDGYRQYPGVLPGGLDFDDSRESATTKLGTPSWSRKRPDGSVVADRWDQDPYRTHITYGRTSGRPTIISLQVPDVA